MKKIPQNLKYSLSPTVLTIFGATGDLAANYLMPALFDMSRKKMLPLKFKLVCVGRRNFLTQDFIKFITQKSKLLRKTDNKKDWKDFARIMKYTRVDFLQNSSYQNLAEELLNFETKFGSHSCFNRLYYFATGPELFLPIAEALKSSNLLEACQGHERQVRVLIEKPFGSNFKTARALNNVLLKYFAESQIYRIDHYVGKETVQNLIVARFGNTIFEPLWNKNFIDHIEVSVLYKDGVEDRAEVYDKMGALKDVIQNHVLQMLALILMDEPRELTANNIRDEKNKVLSSLRKFKAKDMGENLVLGQYQNYKKILKHPSQTETFAALKLFVDLPRWQGMPIYIRTGKKMGKTLTEISIHFKELPRCLFKGCAHNILTFRIQPGESVHLQINNKIPGLGINLHQSDLEFSFHKNFGGNLPSAYERLLLDFLEGDQRLFIRSDEIEAAWQFVDSITLNDIFKKLPCYSYKEGSFGPEESVKLIQQSTQDWWSGE